MAFNDDIHLEAKFLEIRDMYGIQTVIETGTFYANTTQWLAANFKKVYTCEIDAKTYEIAKKKLEGLDNVTHALEASQTFLKAALDQVNEPTIVFLDAHWFENPLLKEIEIVGQSGKRPILVIHDFKVPGKPFGYDTYPGITYDWDYIGEAVEKAYGNQYQKEYNEVTAGANRGCIFIYPT